jgi:hypothetical protein
VRVLKVIDAPWFKITDGTGAFSTASANLLRNRRFRSSYLGHAQIPPNRKTERAGVNAVQALFDKCGYVFQPVALDNDFGKDA